jgi:2-polyprenyl-3-methyl-5-hydroxy-6-metoxy-1,4-benzoquinol methylase
VATKAVLVDGPAGGSTTERPDGGPEDAVDERAYDYIYDYMHESAVANAAGLVRDLVADRSTTVVDLGAGSGIVSHALRDVGVGYHGLEIHPTAVEHMRARGISATQCDLSDLDAVVGALDQVDHVGALMLLDVLEHLLQPHELLTALSRWALEHDRPTLVVSVPNVAHFDVALRLLCGRWIPTATGLLDSTHIRFFTEETLTNLVRRCGWEIVAREDYCVLRGDQYDTVLNDALPAEMVGALRTLSQSENPNAAVQQYVWALRPVPVEQPPATYLEAVGLSADQLAAGPRSDMRAVADYLASAGILASEAARRAVASGYGHHGGGAAAMGRDERTAYLKQKLIQQAYKTPTRRRIFQRLYRAVR